jgi:hypothetical protein
MAGVDVNRTLGIVTMHVAVGETESSQQGVAPGSPDAQIDSASVERRNYPSFAFFFCGSLSLLCPSITVQ